MSGDSPTAKNAAVANSGSNTRIWPFARNGDAHAAAVKDAHSSLLRNYEEMKLGWFWATDADGCITYMTDSIGALLTGGANDILGRELVSLFKPANSDAERRRTLPFQLIRHARFETTQVRIDINGIERCWELSGQPQLDRTGNFCGYLGHGTDVTVEQQSVEENTRLAMYDPLTGLPNRRCVTSLLERTIVAFRVQRRPCAVLLIDLDRFKQINDTMGHPVGDVLLKQVAERLVRIVGDAEKIGRIGGDEFQIVLQDTHDRGALGDMANAIIESLSHPYSINGSRCIIGASVGIAVNPFDGETSEELIRNADLALYAAKSGGRGRFRFFSTELLRSAEERRVLEHDLMDALGNGEIAVHYQPVVNALTNEVSGFEALMRWNHPKRGRISPSIFIPIAEEANLIPQLGEWALRKACMDAASWPGELRVAVNVSPIQFASDSLPQIVLSALANSNLPPDRLELEITESVFLGDTLETEKRFEVLKALGVRLALDDFGTGYSSLGYLRTAPFDKIKIDQSFVRNSTEEGARNQAIIAAIVALAGALGMETTAEGIESFDQLETMRALKVSHVQGFLYSRAVSAEELKNYVEDGRWVIKPSGPAKQRHHRHATFRKVGVIHDNHYYAAVLRNLSASGALIDGIVDVPEGTQFVVDLGDGQLAVATVRRASNHQQGVEFEQRLVDDGNGGLCTRHRVSPLMLASEGLSAELFAPNNNLVVKTLDGQLSLPAFHTLTEWKAAIDGRRVA
ncbi:EAL domain-containing protein [Sphingomonas sp. JC676]|uniref:putative bifunctional diguanylate cyclase/phosphodiesterase n=1 Tax=Sphingomonas sp. JC676 TaxID=2768065 RepID=UPI001658674D|nr:EAL domain-containing protein [Sphingomonas sp. JC676]MBC9032736.1 EAL domain-containing protein [Sphingomonas sp. JC676]